MTSVAVRSWSFAVPDVTGCVLPGVIAESDERILGKRGLLGKTEATRQALCVVHRALGIRDGERPNGPPDPRTGIVVASNLGNVEVVATIARTLESQGFRGTSPLDAPNASSNIIASSIAIRFRFGGPSLTVCSGATAGFDAVGLGLLLLRTRRCERVVVVGVEPADPIARAWSSQPLHASAACLVMTQELGDAQYVLHDLPSGDVGDASDTELVRAWESAFAVCGVLRLALAAAWLTSGRMEAAISAVQATGHRRYVLRHLGAS